MAHPRLPEGACEHYAAGHAALPGKGPAEIREQQSDIRRWRVLLQQAEQEGSQEHIERCRYMLRRLGADERGRQEK